MNLFLRIFATGTIATTYAFTKIPDIASSNATCLPMYAECSHKNLGRAPCCPGTSCWEPTSNCPAGAKACCYRIPETPSDSKSSTLQTADTIPHWGPRQYPSPDHYAQAVESVLTGTAPGLYGLYMLANAVETQIFQLSLNRFHTLLFTCLFAPLPVKYDWDTSKSLSANIEARNAVNESIKIK